MNDWTLDSKRYRYFRDNDSLSLDTVALCEGDSIFWHGIYRDTAGIYVKKYQISETADITYILTLTFNPRPSSYSIAGSNNVLLESSNIFITPEDTAWSYQWLTADGEILSNPTGNTVEIQWGEPGEGYLSSYAVDSNGCVSHTAHLQVSIGTNSTNGFHGDDVIRIYPNLASDILYISSPINLEVEIYDIMGRKLLVSRKKILDVSRYNKGTYILRFKDLNHDVVTSRRLFVF